MEDYGQMVGGGFQPSKPTFDEMMERIQMTGDINSEPPQKSKSQQEQEDLARCYAQFAATPGGQKILEDLMNKTLRSSMAPQGDQTIEAYALSARGHQARCDLMATILAQIEKGRNLPSSAATKKKSSKKKSK